MYFTDNSLPNRVPCHELLLVKSIVFVVSIVSVDSIVSVTQDYTFSTSYKLR